MGLSGVPRAEEKPQRGCKLPAQGRAERSEAAPWVTQTFVLVAPKGQKQCKASEEPSVLNQNRVYALQPLLLPLRGDKIGLHITQGVAPFGRSTLGCELATPLGFFLSA